MALAVGHKAGKGKRMSRPALLASFLLALLSGCSLAPHYERPPFPAPAEWPQGASYEPTPSAAGAGLSWQQLTTDENLRTLLSRALVNNRSLRATIANVAATRAQYHIARSSQFPTLAGNASASLNGGNNALPDSYTLNAGVNAFEIDLFGRLRNQTAAAFETYLGTESGARAARLLLIAKTATAYVTLASDNNLLRIARDTVTSSTRTVELTKSLFIAGLSSAGAVQDALTVLAQAESDVERYTTLGAQDRNALDLLVGARVEDALLAAGLADVDNSVNVAPAGVSSTVLLNRPDVVQAEHQLKSASASIGAARAAFFRTITLTSAAGLASSALSTLLTSSAFTWSVAPAATVPLSGGANRANLEYAKAQHDASVADYERTVQTAFKEVADALARQGTITRQRDAQRRLVESASASFQLADAQYRTGAGSFLTALISQRTLYSARQAETATILTDLTNRIALYQALGADITL